MTLEQIVTLAVLIAVIAALVMDRVRADVVALCGAAILLVSGAVRPVEVQGAFASPAIIALASLFVIAYAMELSGLLDAAIRRGVALCQRIGEAGIWILLVISGVASAFLNNTPMVVMGAPVIRDVSQHLGLSPKRFLIPLSYMAIMGGACTLIGTSTNLIVNDMASLAGEPRFTIFEATPVGLIIALVGGIYLLFASRWLGRVGGDGEGDDGVDTLDTHGPDLHHLQLGSPDMFETRREFNRWKASIAAIVFLGVIAMAAFNLAPIAAAAFGGAVLLVVLKVISADEAYRGLRPEILMLIAGMVVLGIALEKTGLAGEVTEMLVGSLVDLSPFVALVLLYGATLLLTELLSNATVAVLVTPIAVALAETLGVSPRPFVVAVMMAASAAFATPFGYQTNTLVFQMGGYSYMDFVRIGLPLNILTWAVGAAVIPIFFPF
ncbi:MAG: SLC13 family permease [Sphingomicrobium sp.]